MEHIVFILVYVAGIFGFGVLLAKQNEAGKPFWLLVILALLWPILLVVFLGGKVWTRLLARYRIVQEGEVYWVHVRAGFRFRALPSPASSLEQARAKIETLKANKRKIVWRE